MLFVLLCFMLPLSTIAATTTTTATTLHLHSLGRLDLDQAKPRDQARHQHGIVEFPFIGKPQPGGLYYTSIKLGTPRQTFTVLVDTGSDTLWLSCNKCHGCPTAGFDVSSSSTASVLPCTDKRCRGMRDADVDAFYDLSSSCAYKKTYRDGSGTEGHFVSDYLQLKTMIGSAENNDDSAIVAFGCSSSVIGLWADPELPVDGVFGFGPQTSIFTQLASQGTAPAIFSHCFRSDGGGILVLGGIVDPHMAYTPLVPSQTFYKVDLQSISVSGQQLAIDPSIFASSPKTGTIIDSGTSYAYLAIGAYGPFLDAISSAAAAAGFTSFHSSEAWCYMKTSSVMESFPQVSFNFAGGASLVLKPKDYLREVNSSHWCLGILKPDEPSDVEGLTILGDLVLKDKVIVYDLAKQRIGWVNYNCSQPINASAIITNSSSPRGGLLRFLVAVVMGLLII